MCCKATNKQTALVLTVPVPDHCLPSLLFVINIMRQCFNFRYDVAGFFGRSEKSPCDYASVMRTGSSVCEGYANVMEAMCKYDFILLTDMVNILLKRNRR